MRAVLILAALCGCTAADPYAREGMWQPSGANSLNLAAMVSDPHDLIRGHGEAGAQPVQATTAMDRLLADKAKPLLLLTPNVAPGGGSEGK